MSKTPLTGMVLVRMTNKVKMTSSHPLFPMPVCLLGANVSGKPNFTAIAWFSIVDFKPTLIGMSSEKTHYTNKGIRENGTFSANIPSVDMAAVTDYCGIHSGSTVDKSGLFEVFYGELKTAPMIRECPMNVECKLSRIVDFPHDDYIVGEIVEVYAEEKCLVDGRPSLERINPLIFDTEHSGYWKLGERVAEAFSIGKGYKPKPK